MENEKSGNGGMENIFYAALALHVAGKPINKENIRSVLRSAGTPIDEASLEIIAAFMESLQASKLKDESINDPRIIKILTAALSQQKLQVEQLEALLEEFSNPLPPEAKIDNRKAGQRNLVSQSAESAEAGHCQPGEIASREADKAGTPIQELLGDVINRGRYVYAITEAGQDVSLGPIGINGCEVYIVTYRGLGAIVHNCPSEPYQSTDDEQVKAWVQTHQSVVETARENFKNVIPLGFDTILKPGQDAAAADQVVRDWLKNDYARFHTVFSRIEGKDEYAVQISYVPAEISKHLPEASAEVKRLKNEMAQKTPGIAYLYKQKLEKAVKADMDRQIERWSGDFLNRIKQYTEDTIIEKNRRIESGMVMLLNLSCLVAQDRVGSLGDELEKINNLEGFAVHFSGPWPPYSFVAKPIAASASEDSHGAN
jgi:hypothetical protein